MYYENRNFSINKLLLMKQQIMCICRNEYDYFLNKSNVQGIGFGYKKSMGICTFKQCILVFVSQKIPTNQIPPQDIIPKTYRGIETDVIETGYFASNSLKGKVRPVEGGYSIGPDGRTTLGSVACLVTDGTNKFILSNNHVLADENIVEIGTPILQPAMQDGGKNPRDVVAHLSRYIPLKFKTSTTGPINFSDCAIAKLVNSDIATGKIHGIGFPKGFAFAKVGLKVQKVGRTTGKTTGTIISLGATVTVKYDRGMVLLANQIVTTDMTQGGDSGALLLDEKKAVLGLHASGSEYHSTFNLIDNVLDELNVNIVME